MINMVEFINRTTHNIRVERSDRTILEIPAATHSLRITDIKKHGMEHDGIPIHNIRYAFDNLPEEKEGTFYIVSKLVAYNVKRHDFISPDTGPTCTKIDGEVDIIRGFICYAD